MIFKDGHASMPVYLFDRNNLSLEQGKITSFTPSHIDLKMASGKMVVDMTVQTADKAQTLTMDDSLSVAYFGNMAVAIDLDAILREIETMKAASESELKKVEWHRQVVTKCNQLLVDHNPRLKERRETEERFEKTEKHLSSLDDKLDKMMSLMQKYIN